MEIFDTLITNLSDYISWGYLLAFVFLSYGWRNLVGELLWVITSHWLAKSTKMKSMRVYAVFVIALIMAPIWWYFTQEEIMKMVTTYAIGTSLYELIIQRVINLLKKKEEPTFKDMAE